MRKKSLFLFALLPAPSLCITIINRARCAIKIAMHKPNRDFRPVFLKDKQSLIIQSFTAFFIQRLDSDKPELVYSKQDTDTVLIGPKTVIVYQKTDKQED